MNALGLKELRVKRVSQLRKWFLARDRQSLRGVTSDLAEEAFVYEDEALLDACLLAYSFSKFFEKPYVTQSAEWKRFARRLDASLEQAMQAFKKDDAQGGTIVLSSLVAEVEQLSASLGRFIRTTVEKARIKAATQMYAHGASLGKAASFAKANLKEVASYIGATKLQEKYATMSVRERLERAKKLF